MTTHAETDDPAVDARAPVVASAEIEIDAAPAVVWDVLAAVESWPSWNPDVKSVAVEGPLREGSSFRWKAGPGTIDSTVRRLERPRLIAWTGTTLGIRAVHVWHLEPRDGKTLVRTEESYDGLVARLLRRPLRKTLDTTLANGVRSLKAEAEKAGTTPP
jgi:hypothetical protein